MNKITCLNKFGFSPISRLVKVKPKGFTLIELLLVIALFSTILVLATVNLFKPLSSAKIESISSDIVSITLEAQNKAMNTHTQGQVLTSPYGIHFETNKYTLFKGAGFNASDPNNFVVDVPQGIVVSSNLPSNNVVFQQISGEVIGFDNSRNTVCLKETSSNKTVLIRVNFVGVVDVLQQSCS